MSEHNSMVKISEEKNIRDSPLEPGLKTKFYQYCDIRQMVHDVCRYASQNVMNF